MRYLAIGCLAILVAHKSPTVPAADRPLRVAVFEADVTPPIGAPLCDGFVPPAKEIVDRLSARGIVLLTADKPIVLCAFDWVGIGNGGFDAFREELAIAAGTTADRVAVHCLHQHDAPGSDFLADELLAAHGLGNRLFDLSFARTALKRTALALTESLKTPRDITHVGYGKGKVEQVASNRRVMGPDGKVKAIRWSATTDAAVRAEPEGTIDPFVHLVSLWNGETPIVTLSYYATHPQSHYAKGGVSCDFPGLARGIRDREEPDVTHIHFNGAAGNVTAGKYNDGAPENRPLLAGRLAAGMKAAREATVKSPIRAAEVGWNVRPVALPPATSLDRDKLRATIGDANANLLTRLRAARELAWLERCLAGHKIDITLLSVGSIAILHMPGELFVEYQLAAQQMRPNAPTVMAAYGDYGPGYIGLRESYPQGGYETGYASLVAPEVEAVLMEAMRDLLK
jgi:hypothetical protein